MNDILYLIYLLFQLSTKSSMRMKADQVLALFLLHHLKMKVLSAVWAVDATYVIRRASRHGTHAIHLSTHDDVVSRLMSFWRRTPQHRLQN